MSIGNPANGEIIGNMTRSRKFSYFSATRKSLLAAAFAFAAASPVLAGDPPEIGLWYDDSGRGAVEIARCADRLCGYIVWLRSPLNAAGQPLRDIYNPEPGQQRRPICGIQVLGDLQVQPDGAWDNGWVYDPKVGQSYNVEIRLVDPKTLSVHGYAGLKLLGKTMTWTRAPADLPRCEENPVPATLQARP